MASRICTRLSTFSRRALNECRSLCLGRPLLIAVGDPPDGEPHVPPYRERFDEPLKVKKARLLYQSRKRGILENELLLSTFAAKYLDKMDEEQLEEYDRLINLPTNDWDIYYWITGKERTPVEFHSKVLELLKKHVYNRDRECRTRMPDLY